MTRDEAKELLQLCRPGNEADRNAPELAEAFAMLESDAELREWFDDQQAFDARFADALADLDVPPGLKERILESQSAPANDLAKGVPGAGRNDLGSTDPSWWRKAWPLLATAAAVAVAVFAAQTWQLREEGPSAAPAPAVAGVPDIVSFLAERIDALPQKGLDKMDHRLDELNAFLARKSAPTPASIPAAMQEAPPIGCVTFDYGGTKISMICFRNGTVYHLATVQKKDIKDAGSFRHGDYQVGTHAFRLWEEGDQVHILSLHGRTEDLPEPTLPNENTA